MTTTELGLLMGVSVPLGAASVGSESPAGAEVPTLSLLSVVVADGLAPFALLGNPHPWAWLPEPWTPIRRRRSA